MRYLYLYFVVLKSLFDRTVVAQLERNRSSRVVIRRAELHCHSDISIWKSDPSSQFFFHVLLPTLLRGTTSRADPPPFYPKATQINNPMSPVITQNLVALPANVDEKSDVWTPNIAGAENPVKTSSEFAYKVSVGLPLP